MDTYCLKCKKNTKTCNIKHEITKNGTPRIVGICADCGKNKSKFVKKKKIEKLNIREEIIEELHKPMRKNFPRRKVITFGIDDLWQADLVEMNSGQLKGISRINNGFSYILTVIDVFSKYAWAIPVKDKSGKTVTATMKSIFQNKRIPKYLQTDKGKEFYNTDFKLLMKEYNIHHYSSFSEKKASVVERLNRTLKQKMWKKFDLNGNYKWINTLQSVVHEYNNTKHRTIKMKPIDVNADNEQYMKDTIYLRKITPVNIKFKIGDKVRISKFKSIFDKSYTGNWSTEIFEIKNVVYSNPVTYLLKDSKNEDIEGLFYEYELQKTKYPDIYLIEKVLRKKGNKMYVKWLGFDNMHNSWINKSENVN